jgi:hypothetical protein
VTLFTQKQHEHQTPQAQECCNAARLANLETTQLPHAISIVLNISQLQALAAGQALQVHHFTQLGCMLMQTP